MSDSIVERAGRIEKYIIAVDSVMNRLKASVMVNSEKEISNYSKQAELLLDEIEKEVITMKNINITDEATKAVIKEKLIAILKAAKEKIEQGKI